MPKVIRIFTLQLKVPHVVCGYIRDMSRRPVRSQTSQLKVIVVEGHQVGAPSILRNFYDPV